jgi:hypothetical protein
VKAGNNTISSHLFIDERLKQGPGSTGGITAASVPGRDSEELEINMDAIVIPPAGWLVLRDYPSTEGNKQDG